MEKFETVYVVGKCINATVVIKGLEDETFESQDLNLSFDDTGQLDQEIDFNSLPTIKPDIRLPKTDFYWKLANDLFTANRKCKQEAY